MTMIEEWGNKTPDKLDEHGAREIPMQEGTQAKTDDRPHGVWCAADCVHRKAVNQKLVELHYSTCFQDVGKFHHQMELPLFTDQAPHFLRQAEFNFRTAAMFEELREFIECHTLKDLAGAADALVDLVYFALGTAHYMGLPFDACWTAVQQANMTKRRWQPGDPIKPRNGTSLDVIKPAGWRAPDILQLLLDHKESVLRNQGVRP